MEAALEAKVNYIDLGGLFHMTKKQLPLHKRFQEAGLLAILGLGSTPGTTNVMTSWAASRLDRVSSVSILSGAHDEGSGQSFSFPYSLDTILDELTKEAPVLKNGKLEFVSPLSLPEEVVFPSPIGKMTVYATIHSEQATLPDFLATKGLQYLAFKFALPHEALTVVRALVDLGLATEDGRQFLREQTYKNRKTQTNAATQEWEALDVVVNGEEKNIPTNYILKMLVSPSDSVYTAGSWNTAVPSCIAAKWILDGTIKKTGVLPPENVIEPDRFLSELSSYNLRVQCHKDFPIYLPNKVPITNK